MDVFPLTTRSVPAEVVNDDPSPDDTQLAPIPDIVISDEEISNLTSSSRLPQVIDDDMKMINFALAHLKVRFQSTHDADSICKLALSTGKLLETRRKLLCLQYGTERATQGGRKRRDSVFGPLDD